jgi:UDP-N-acetylmuramoyl-L-alanyl-D-glutamate--2,6-diaminopimelate ligase
VAFSERRDSAEVRISKVEAGAGGLRFRIASPWGEAPVRCSLIGAFNVANVVAALVAALEAGLPLETLSAALENLSPVPGRMQPLRHAGAPLVVIDFAHTPDALRQVLDTLRALCAGRLIVVFGCGGDRDRGKRPLMGEAVSAVADLAVITSDNPRSEDPLAIIRDIEAGMRGAYRVCADREEAICSAIEEGAPGDCVLIAGKGHEAFQVVGDQRRPFDDAAVARQCLEGIAA